MTPLLAAIVVMQAQSASQTEDYKGQIENWRAGQTRELMQDEGWLTLAGLTWLKEGENTIGAAENCDVKLPDDARGNVGTLILKAGQVTFRPATEKIDQSIHPEQERIHSLSVFFKIIVRGDRVGVRFYDTKAKTRTNFPGQKWFPVDEHYRIQAKFIPFDPPKQVPITNVLGDTSLQEAAGIAEFQIGGKTCRLMALKQGSGLFFNFKDATNRMTTPSKATYPAGRFLDADAPQTGPNGSFVFLDFNKAVNPPCAFTPYATCPLPPKENVLPIAITAGELVFHHD